MGLIDLKKGAVLAAYILYRLKGGPAITEVLKEKALNLIANHIPIPIQQTKPITVRLNDTEWKIF
jgi:hypothetical protein